MILSAFHYRIIIRVDKSLDDSWNTISYCKVWNIFCYDGTGSDHGLFSDMNFWKEYAAYADANSILDGGSSQMFPVRSSITRIFLSVIVHFRVVRGHAERCHENVVTDSCFLPEMIVRMDQGVPSNSYVTFQHAQVCDN